MTDRLTKRLCWGTWLAVGFFSLFPPSLIAAEDSAISRLEHIYHQARSRFQESTNSIEAAWQFGRACFDMADVAKTDSERARLAEEGIDACRTALAHKYGSGPPHYYLALNLGELARTKSLGALKLVREMETEFKQAIELDEKFDFGGPHRSVGLLYKDAPGWPTSIGSRNKARLHLRRANDLSLPFLLTVLFASVVTLPYMLHAGQPVFAASQGANILVWGTVLYFRLRFGRSAPG